VAVADEVASFIVERRYGDKTLQTWRELSDIDARALLSVASELQPSENQLRDLWTCAQEIADRDCLSLADVLDSPALRGVRQRAVGRSEKIKLLKTALRRLRFPHLVAAEQRAAGLVAALALPRHVQVELPTNLEGEAVRFHVIADDVTALRSAATALLEATDQAECRALFGLLEDAS